MLVRKVERDEVRPGATLFSGALGGLANLQAAASQSGAGALGGLADLQAAASQSGAELLTSASRTAAAVVASSPVPTPVVPPVPAKLLQRFQDGANRVTHEVQDVVQRGERTLRAAPNLALEPAARETRGPRGASRAAAVATAAEEGTPPGTSGETRGPRGTSRAAAAAEEVSPPVTSRAALLRELLDGQRTQAAKLACIEARIGALEQKGGAAPSASSASEDEDAVARLTKVRASHSAPSWRSVSASMMLANGGGDGKSSSSLLRDMATRAIEEANQEEPGSHELREHSIVGVRRNQRLLPMYWDKATMCACFMLCGMALTVFVVVTSLV